MQRGAVMLRADIDMGGCHRGLATDRGIAERGVEARIFVRHRDQPRRSPAERLRLGDRLLVEAELGARAEEQMINAAVDQRGDDRFAHVANFNLDH